MSSFIFPDTQDLPHLLDEFRRCVLQYTNLVCCHDYLRFFFFSEFAAVIICVFFFEFNAIHCLFWSFDSFFFEFNAIACLSWSFVCFYFIAEIYDYLSSLV